MKKSLNEVVEQQLQKVDLTQRPPELKYLETPMSKPAREALNSLMELVATELKRPSLLGPAFANLDLYEFERNVQRVNMAGYREYLRNMARECYRRREPMPAQAVVASMSTVLADRLTVVEFQLEKSAAAQVLFPTEPHSAETYRWLTQNFLLVDFEAGEVHKVADLCRRFTRAQLEPIAADIKKPEERRINILYHRVTQSEEVREKLRAVERVKEAENNRKLAALFAVEAEAKHKVVHKPDPDAKQRWERTRAYVDVLLSLDGDA